MSSKDRQPKSQYKFNPRGPPKKVVKTGADLKMFSTMNLKDPEHFNQNKYPENSSAPNTGGYKPQSSPNQPNRLSPSSSQDSASPVTPQEPGYAAYSFASPPAPSPYVLPNNATKPTQQSIQHDHFDSNGHLYQQPAGNMPHVAGHGVPGLWPEAAPQRLHGEAYPQTTPVPANFNAYHHQVSHTAPQYPPGRTFNPRISMPQNVGHQPPFTGHNDSQMSNLDYGNQPGQQDYGNRYQQSIEWSRNHRSFEDQVGLNAPQDESEGSDGGA